MKMKLGKKMIALLTAVALALAVGVPALAAAEDGGFSDVAADAWYADAVKYVSDNGLMSGTSEKEFSPNAITNRGMMAAILYRQAGSPAVSQKAEFSDVADGAWYGDAVSWASQNGVASGFSDGRFGPGDPVTREQMTAILWRYSGSPAAGSNETFADQSSISAYAVDAVAWAKENGIISGKDGNLFDPDGQTTRAEAAVMLQRYVTGLGQTGTPSLPDSSAGTGTAITITAGDTVISAILNDSTSAKDLISRLPLTVSMTRGSVDYYSSLSQLLDYDEADRHNGWHNGDIGFDGTYLTMFHSGEDTSESSANQITLGHISNLALLDGLGSSIQATFALADSSDDSSSNRTLVVYYSHSQRTEGVARQIQEKTGGDIYELLPAEPYTGADSVIAERSTAEIESGNLPEFDRSLPDLSRYDTVLVGGPVWNYTVSAPVLSYLKKADFSGKTVGAFWTDQGGPGDYEEVFINSIRNASRVADFLQLTNTPSISESDMNRRLDAWLETVFDGASVS